MRAQAEQTPVASRPTLDRALNELHDARNAWARLPMARKIDYARGILDGIQRTARGQVAAAIEAKGLEPESRAAGEEWIAGPYVTTRVLRLLIESLETLRRLGGLPVEPDRIRSCGEAQIAVEVFPHDLFDRIFYSGFQAEVWMEPGVNRSNLGRFTASRFRERRPEGRVALVLGAGNVASIGPLDVVHKLFSEGQVAILKFNPVNDYLGPFFEDAFGELIRDGYVRTAYGGADVGRYLVSHELVDEIHITGGAATHDAIVFGTGPEGARRKAAGEPLLDKRITSELGNVSPVILVPGAWTRSQLRFHAQNVATQMVQNSGFNCNASKVLLTQRGWPLRERFLAELRSVLRGLAGRPAYYPGAEERYRRFRQAYPASVQLGPVDGEHLPPALATGLEPESCDPLAFEEESFCAFTAEATLPAKDAEEFLAQAVAFSNERLYGTLNACVVIDPKTERRLGPALEEAIADLRYGTVAINQWPALGFALGSTPWGAYPGHTLEDIQSGIGHVHNTHFFDRPQKTVIRAPFTVWPKPPWFVTHGRALRLGELLTRFEAAPSFLHLPEIFVTALRG